ncbi:MAG: hypothetical protein FWD53_00740 [Phycisphaerales bacterium]|nr:hypothetical protein [Phycisphaerales bacterium]
MNSRILHLLDASTPSDALELLAMLLANSPPGTHQLAALGHHSTKTLATLSNIPPESITFLPSAGWADPTGWRATKKICQKLQPTHAHAWGIPAALALAASKFQGKRIATLTDLPSPQHLTILHLVNWHGKKPFTWTTTQPALRKRLGLPAVQLTPLAMKQLEPRDGNPGLWAANDRGGGGGSPTLLLAGDGPRARHDIGLWVVGILHHLFPKLRTIIHEDPRNRPNPGLNKMLSSLTDPNTSIIAPPDTPWPTLAQAADVLLLTADAPIPTTPIFAAINAAIPIVAGPNPTVLDLLQPNTSALIAPSFKPREIAAQLETLLSNPSLAQSLTTAAQSQHTPNPTAVLNAYNALYEVPQ